MTTRRTGASSKELQAARRKKRHRRVVRNRIMFATACILILILIIFIISKLVAAVIGRGKPAEVSTLTFNTDGSVVFEEVIPFDEEKYSPKDLKSFTRDMISSFDEAAGDEAIVLDKIKVDDGQAYIKTKYSTADNYAAFTSYSVYMNTVEAAGEAGYAFDTTFCQVIDGVKGDVLNTNVLSEFTGCYVAIIEENVTVNVPGDILFISSVSTEMVDNNTVTIAQKDGNPDATDRVYIIFSMEE